ncbi:Uncharacterised protein [Serratia marcescens]|nr:Uncharacterised protein [Serratia marcescens]
MPPLPQKRRDSLVGLMGLGQWAFWLKEQLYLQEFLLAVYFPEALVH